MAAASSENIGRARADVSPDRAAIERLFGVRRRRAIQLMSAFGGGYIVGKTFLIWRRELIASLEVAGRRIAIPAPGDANERTVEGLPAGIHLMYPCPSAAKMSSRG